MGLVSDIFSGVVKSIPVLLAKIGTVFLFVFALGMAVGYFFAMAGYNFIVLLVPLAAMAVMWQKLDEGTLVFLLLLAAALIIPELFLW